MLKGIPVIMPDFGEWTDFNRVNDCGINVDPNNHTQVAEAIKHLNNNPKEKARLGNNGRKAVLEKYNWNLAENRLIKLYDSLL